MNHDQNTLSSLPQWKSFYNPLRRWFDHHPPINALFPSSCFSHDKSGTYGLKIGYQIAF